MGTVVDEAPAQVDGLVRGDAAGDPEDDACARQPGGDGLTCYLISSSASSGRRKVILSAAISSRAMESGLRDTEVTCGGTMAPSPSPSWLK